ncbi:MAG: hypothetical protein OER43_04245 [Gammaproteobacteria bacterium]|nr:hypothetical protein [Gammaproteobacteria bacterium]MDH3414086.1 hypothetical protein [Gammaproteobacteria bacterium]
MTVTRPKAATPVVKAMITVYPTARAMDSKDEPEREMVECYERIRVQQACSPARNSR